MKERFGQGYIRFKHPSGLQMEVIEDPDDKRKGWVTPEVSSDVSMKGFQGAVLSVREISGNRTLLCGCAWACAKSASMATLIA